MHGCTYIMYVTIDECIMYNVYPRTYECAHVPSCMLAFMHVVCMYARIIVCMHIIYMYVSITK